MLCVTGCRFLYDSTIKSFHNNIMLEQLWHCYGQRIKRDVCHFINLCSDTLLSLSQQKLGISYYVIIVFIIQYLISFVILLQVRMNPLAIICTTGRTIFYFLNHWGWIFLSLPRIFQIAARIFMKSVFMRNISVEISS